MPVVVENAELLVFPVPKVNKVQLVHPDVKDQLVLLVPPEPLVKLVLLVDKVVKVIQVLVVLKVVPVFPVIQVQLGEMVLSDHLVKMEKLEHQVHKETKVIKELPDDKVKRVTKDQRENGDQMVNPVLSVLLVPMV